MQKQVENVFPTMLNYSFVVGGARAVTLSVSLQYTLSGADRPFVSTSQNKVEELLLFPSVFDFSCENPVAATVTLAYLHF